MTQIALNMDIDINEKDIIYLIKNNEIQKNKKYLVHSLEIKEVGNWHDGYIYDHYAFLEEIDSKLLSHQLIAITSKMLQIKDLYFVKCN
jgi:hypothetical protein